MTLSEKYTFLKSQCTRHHVIMKHVGQQNSEGGWTTPPRVDEFGNPLIDIVIKKNVNDWKGNGWALFEMEIPRAPVKAARKPQTPETVAPKPRTRAKRTKK